MKMSDGMFQNCFQFPCSSTSLSSSKLILIPSSTTLPSQLVSLLHLTHMCASISPPHPLRFGCLRSNPPFGFFLVVFFLLISCVIATTDYPTLALRDTLSSLCEVNQEGKFGSCCRAYDISSVSIEKSEERDCFISNLISTSDGIEYLFVHLRLFHIFMSPLSHFSSYHFMTRD